MAEVLDVAATMALQRMIRRRYKGITGEIVLPKGKVKNPTIWVAMKAHATNVPGSGPMRVTKGQEIKAPGVVKAFLAAGADIRPLR